MARQFVVQLKNQPGALAVLAEALAAAGVDLRAIGGGSIGDSGHVIMTTADDATKAILDQGGYTYVEGEAILSEVGDRPGGMAAVARELADAGVNIQGHLFLGRWGDRAMFTFVVDKPDIARPILERKPPSRAFSTDRERRPRMPAMRILAVEDEAKMAALIKRVLSTEGHVVDVAPDGVSATALARSGPYDVIVLDRMLPDIDGVTLLRLLRTKGIATPVLMLTALGGIDDRVDGLDAGADDYLAKPFAFAELIARIRALGRRSTVAPDRRLQAGDLSLDELRHVAQVGDRTVDLSAREYALLGYLILNAGQVLTRRQILEAVWGAEPDASSNVVDLYVHYLRRKLGQLGRAERLRTVRGVGYTLRAEA